MGGRGTQSPYRNPQDVGFFSWLMLLSGGSFLCFTRFSLVSGAACMLFLVANLLGQVYQVC